MLYSRPNWKRCRLGCLKIWRHLSKINTTKFQQELLTGNIEKVYKKQREILDSHKFNLGLCGGPDVTGNRTDHDRASSLLNEFNNRKTSFDSASSAEFSDIDFSDSAYDDLTATIDDDCGEVVKKILNFSQPARITLKLHITENTVSIWETVLHPSNNTLYVALPSVLLPEASKQSFITLLEFAEEKLGCSSVVLCMRKDRADRQNLVRTFLFLGFQPLSPKSELAPPQNSENNLYLIYNIED